MYNLLPIQTISYPNDKITAIAIILSNKDRYKGIGYAAFGLVIFLFFLWIVACIAIWTGWSG